jgi:hypothetical protein
VQSVERIQRRIAVLTLVAMSIVFACGWPRWESVLLGGGTVAASLWLYGRLFDAVIRTGRRRLALGLTFVKLAAFLALGWWAMSGGAGMIDPLGFAAGVTCLPLAALWEAFRTKRN